MENQLTKTIIFVDSNYWIYLFDKTTPEHEVVREHFQKIYSDSNIVANTVVMMEVMHYLVKRLGPEIAQQKWELFRAIPYEIGDLMHVELDSVFQMLKTYSFTGIGGRDATILSYMKSKGITEIATHDEAFAHVDFVTVVDPIK